MKITIFTKLLYTENHSFKCKFSWLEKYRPNDDFPKNTYIFPKDVFEFSHRL
jgi:hypothetical protein